MISIPMRYRNIFISVMMTLVLGLASWGSYISYRPATPAFGSDKADLPDGYMLGVTAMIMNKEGELHMQIKTPQLIHYSQNDVSKFTTPELTIYQDTSEPWCITSQLGYANHGIDKVDFIKNVILRHTEDASIPNTRITTSLLTVYPHKKIAMTDKPITLMQPNTTFNAIGMHADMNKGDIKLLTHTRGAYVPKQ